MIKVLDSALSKLEVAMIVSFTLASLFMAFLQVVLRYVFNTGIHWLEAALVTSLIWAMLMGAVRAVREGFHPRVDLVPHMMPPKARAVLNFLSVFAAFVLACYLLWDSVFYARFLNMVNALHPELGIKQLYPFLIVPIITFLMALRYSLVLWALCSKPDAMFPEAEFRHLVGDDSKKEILD